MSGANGSLCRMDPPTGSGVNPRSTCCSPITSKAPLFVAGCKSNQGKFYPRFDHIVLLSAPAGVLLARIAARDNNPYGKSPAERDQILHHLATVEPLLRATATDEIDTSAPISQVVRQLEALDRQATRGESDGETCPHDDVA